MVQRYHIRVSGRVQRVSFRAHTVKQATKLGLAGRATNLSDGSVEVIAQGEETALQQLLDWLHRGPVLARVDEVTWDEVQVDHDLGTDFIRN